MSEPESRGRTAFEDVMRAARTSMAERDFDAAWLALERAHVIGQRDAVLHLRSHWWMLRCGVKTRDAREVVGQIVRLVLAAPGSIFGKAPPGNTGRARVGLFQPMEISPELRELLG
jgi:hypothetical protein